MHPGNPASARYWNNIWEGDIFDRTGIEEVTRYANTTNKYLETLKMPYYFEEFDYNGNGTLSLGVDGVLWRDEAKRPDIYERLELLLNDGDEDTPPHHTLSEDDEEIAEEQDDAPRVGDNLITNGTFPTVNSLDNFEIQTLLGNEINGVDNGLVTMEWVDNAVKFTILSGRGNCIDNQCDNGANGLDGNGYCTKEMVYLQIIVVLILNSLKKYHFNMEKHIDFHIGLKLVYPEHFKFYSFWHGGDNGFGKSNYRLSNFYL